MLDHGLERLEQRLPVEAGWLEQAERFADGFDGRDAVQRRLAANAVAARRARRERVAWQRGKLWILLKQLLRLPPGAVEHDERHRACGRRRCQIASVVARVEQDGGRRRVVQARAQRWHFVDLDR